ncbi:MAG: hypothetical protein ABJC05_06630 [Pyrinomonadaceae bacterium]
MLAPDTVLQGRYRIVKQLGQGGSFRLIQVFRMNGAAAAEHECAVA